jgi:tRNA(fMet)-specific endonuclease VapC
LKYLLDTNIIIYFFKKKFGLRDKFREAGEENLVISEITLAELRFGAENSSNPEKHQKEVADFTKAIPVLPITPVIDVFAFEKTRLQKSGMPLDNFDLLIAATAISHNLILVTNNTKHFNRFPSLMIEDWTSLEEIG